MEPWLVIERLGRGGEVIERLRRRIERGSRLGIGRGYDCDMQLDDPYTAPLHLYVQRDQEGLLWVEDADSLNGLRELDQGQRVKRLRVHGQALVEIGHTRLRISDGNPRVEPERPLHGASRSPGGWAFLWLAASLLVGLGSSWLDQTGEWETAQIVGGLTALAIMTLVWSSAWSLSNRLFTHELRFLRHLRVAAMFSILLTAAEALAEMLAYAFNISWLQRFDYVLVWVLLALLCWRHLQIIGPAHPRAKAVAMLLMAALAIGLQSVSRFAPKEDGGAEPQYLSQLQPVFLRLRAPQSADDFLAAAARLQAELDAARAQDDEAQVPD